MNNRTREVVKHYTIIVAMVAGALFFGFALFRIAIPSCQPGYTPVQGTFRFVCAKIEVAP